jgi:hypothetical protein
LGAFSLYCRFGDLADRSKVIGGRDAVIFVAHCANLFKRMVENVGKFLDEFAAALAAGTFVKATLGNYKGGDEHLQKVLIRAIETKKGRRLFFLYRYDARDTAKNFAFDEALSEVARLLDGEFFSGHLFTTENDLQLDIGRNDRSRLNIAKPTFTSAPSVEHDRQKKLQIDPGAFYLRALGITTDRGEIREKQQDKWRQINKFVEVLASLIERSELKDRRELRIVDMGSGKGYLTFAAYDHFNNTRGIDASVVGVEARSDLVDLCNDIARSSEFDKLKFVNGTIGSYDVGNIDVLIALHACDTATDDAVHKGIKAGANLVMVAPCCHQEIRPQITPPAMFKDVLKHGLMLERTAEIVTDAMRALLLEREGYAVKMIEFVPVEHTPKNNLIVGTRLKKPRDTGTIEREIVEIKQFYGIRRHRLDTLLSQNKEKSDAVQRQNA